MITSQYYPGSSITLSAAFTSPTSGALVDPTMVSLEVQVPDGTIAHPTVIPVTVGQYSASFTATVSGTYTQRWVGAGANAQVAESVFLVLPTGIL